MSLLKNKIAVVTGGSGIGLATARLVEEGATCSSPVARQADLDKAVAEMGKRPEEIASAALFLASDQSCYIAGIELPVEGGLTVCLISDRPSKQSGSQ